MAVKIQSSFGRIADDICVTNWSHRDDVSEKLKRFGIDFGDYMLMKMRELGNLPGSRINLYQDLVSLIPLS